MYNFSIMRRLLEEFRWWIVSAIAIFGAAHVVAYEQHRASARYQAHRADYCAAFLRTPEEQEACKEEKREAKDYLKWWQILYTWPEGMTVWAIIATGFIIAWQSYETRRAANATADGNRAWIFADLKKLGDKTFSNEATRNATYLLASLHIRNEGLSPAWIESVHAHMEILPRKQKPPKKVKFDLCPYVSTIMVKGGDVFNPEFECAGHLTKESDWLFIWVVIKYHDGHGINGETSLGYAMSLSGMLFRQTNLPERNYNK